MVETKKKSLWDQWSGKRVKCECGNDAEHGFDVVSRDEGLESYGIINAVRTRYFQCNKCGNEFPMGPGREYQLRGGILYDKFKCEGKMKKQIWVNFTTLEYFAVFLRADKEKHPVAMFEYEEEATKWMKANCSHRGDVEIELVMVSASRKA